MISAPVRRGTLELRDTILVLTDALPLTLFVMRKGWGSGSLAQHLLSSGIGGLRVDACRVGCADRPLRISEDHGLPRNTYGGGMGLRGGGRAAGTTRQGRWPSNLLLVHTSGCRRVGIREVAAPVINRFTDGMKPFGHGAGHLYESVGRGDLETVDVWNCTECCPVRAVDAQSGDRPGMPLQQNRAGDSRKGYDGEWRSDPGSPGYGDAGGASRFFPCLADLDDLRQWLVRLVTPPGGSYLLDPIMHEPLEGQVRVL